MLTERRYRTEAADQPAEDRLQVLPRQPGPPQQRDQGDAERLPG